LRNASQRGLTTAATDMVVAADVRRRKHVVVEPRSQCPVSLDIIRDLVGRFIANFYRKLHRIGSGYTLADRSSERQSAQH
jgi:hypothetical protein